MKDLIDKLEQTSSLSKEEWSVLIRSRTPDTADYLFERAREIRHRFYRKDIYIRGLIEFTNYCKNDCLYCGIRRSNQNVHRYRLSREQILDCCEKGYELGFRTFVLQGGEDGYYTDEVMTDIVQNVRKRFPDCAITLSLGERSRESYQLLFDAGAERYLLRHETYDAEHYGRLHPNSLSAAHRQQCLWNLKDIGYQDF